jgi:hypothetical protein
MRPLFAILGALLMGLQGAAAATSTPIDPAVTGLWVPDYHANAEYVAQSEMDIFADGTDVAREYDIANAPATALYVPVKNDGPRPYLQWIINGTMLDSKGVDTGTAAFSNGQFKTSFPDESDSGSYKLNADGRVMTMTMGKYQLVMKKVADATGKMIAKPKAAAAPVTSGGIDPQLAGLWREAIPMPDKGYTLETVFEIHPNGTFVQHIQHEATGQDVVVGNNSADVETDNATVRAANGRFTETMAKGGATYSASYVFDHAGTKMIVIYDQDTYGYLFVRMGDVGADNSLSVSSILSVLDAVHVVDPKLVRVWIGGQQTGNNIKYIMIEWHPNGDFVMHVRNTTGSQSVMDVKDSATYPGQYDAFNGRFLLNEPNDLRETGVYSFTYGTPNGTQLNLSWDTNKTATDTFRVFGDFDVNGAIRPLPAAK